MGDSEQIRVNTFVENQLDRLAGEIETKLKADLMAIVGPIYPGLDDAVRQAIESRKQRMASLQKCLAIILDTDGGIIEVVERMVNTIRHHYTESYDDCPKPGDVGRNCVCHVGRPHHDGLLFLPRPN